MKEEAKKRLRDKKIVLIGTLTSSIEIGGLGNTYIRWTFTPSSNNDYRRMVEKVSKYAITPSFSVEVVINDPVQQCYEDNLTSLRYDLSKKKRELKEAEYRIKKLKKPA